jgi:hypothetical protein
LQGWRGQDWDFRLFLAVSSWMVWEKGESCLLTLNELEPRNSWRRSTIFGASCRRNIEKCSISRLLLHRILIEDQSKFTSLLE